MATKTATKHTMTMEECLAACTRCYEVCLQTINHCVTQGGDHATPHHIRMLMDCAEICRTSMNFLIRGSQYHGFTCFVCAEICRACAEDCERFKGDRAMQECAEACRRCEESCKMMALESGISVEYADLEFNQEGAAYGDAFEQVAEGARQGHNGGTDYGEPFEVVAEAAQKQGKAGRRNARSDS